MMIGASVLLSLTVLSASDWPPALSFLRPKGAACEWAVAASLEAPIRVLTTFDGRCEDVRLWLGPTGKKALAASNPKAGALQYDEVQLPSGKKKSLAAPPRGDLELLAYDAKGNPIAVMLESPINTDRKDIKLEKNTIVFAGKPYPACDQDLCVGEPLLAHGFRLEPKGWVRVETTAFLEVEGGLGARILELSREAQGSRLQGGRCGAVPFERVKDPRLLGTLEPWRRSRSGADWVYVTSDKSVVSLTGDRKGGVALPLMFVDGGSVMPVFDNPPAGIQEVSVTCDANLMLLSLKTDSAATSKRYLYERKTRKKVTSWSNWDVQLWVPPAASKAPEPEPEHDPLTDTFE